MNAGDTPEPAGKQDSFPYRGIATACGAYLLWGFFPVYLKALGPAVSTPEILAHFVIWSLLFCAALLTLFRQWPQVREAIATPRTFFMLAASGLCIALNWSVYVGAVSANRILEAGLGYYLNPLMYVAVGILLLGERAGPVRYAAIFLAATGVAVLAAGSRVMPWTPVMIAVLFTLYGYIRKTVRTGPLPGLFTEMLVLSPAALAYLFWPVRTGTVMFPEHDPGTNFLLVLAGPVTVMPLLLFTISARCINLSTLGFIQYISPTLQFSLGIYYGEVFSPYHVACFAMIWTALVLFTVDAALPGKKTRHDYSRPPQPVRNSAKNTADPAA